MAINWKAGLSDTQKQSIENLYKNKSSDKWNTTDWSNWNYATGSQDVKTALQSNMPMSSPEIDLNQTSKTLINDFGQDSILGNFLQSTFNTTMTNTQKAIQNFLGQRELERTEAETSAQKKLDTASLNLEELNAGESYEDIKRRLMSEFNMEDTRKKLEGYENELVSLQENYLLVNQQIANKPIHAGIIRGQQYLKEQEYANKATTIQAKVAIASEQYDLAKQSVESLFEAAAADREQKRSNLERLFDLAREDLITLNTEEKENINAIISTIQEAEKQAQENQEKMVSLFADPVMAKAFQQSGANLNMNFTDVMYEMLPYIVAENTRQEQLKSSSGGTSVIKDIGGYTGNLKKEAERLAKLRDSGQLTDNDYDYAISSLVDTLYPDASAEESSKLYEQISSDVNQIMEGSYGSTTNTNTTQTEEQVDGSSISVSENNSLLKKSGFEKFATNPAFSSLFNRLGLYGRFGLDYDSKTDSFRNK